LCLLSYCAILLLHFQVHVRESNTLTTVLLYIYTTMYYKLYKVPELASLGRVFRSTVAVPLTESEVEYVVHCVKHILDDNRHVVLDFSVHNTIQDQMLQQVLVQTYQ
jgi:Coatomer gamma subunit appendage platform subdomain